MWKKINKTVFRYYSFYHLLAVSLIFSHFLFSVVIAQEREIKKLPEILSFSNLKETQAHLLASQNSPEKIEALTKFLQHYSGDGLPVIEFFQISPVKYRFHIHGVKSGFPLVFSENFHKWWKLYPIPGRKKELSLANSEILNQYKILQGNEDSQASVDELKEYIKRGWIHTLGDGDRKEKKHLRFLDNSKRIENHTEEYRVGFISKNIHNVIQNNNLRDGRFFETWVRSPLEEQYHLLINGYANLWLVDFNDLEKNSPNSLEKNSDGSYDLEMVLEFWSQRLFFLGFVVSGGTFLFLMGYLLFFDRVRN